MSVTTVLPLAFLGYWKMSEVFGQFENFYFSIKISERGFFITSSDYM